MFPADPVGIGMMLEPLGLAAGPVVPTREWRELYAALDCAAVAAIHPFYTASLREFEAAGRHDRRLRAGRPSTAPPPGSKRSATACGVARDKIDAAQEPLPARRSRRRSRRSPIDGRITLSGYEGSELLVARLLVESGADVRYVGTACPRTPWSDADREWLEARGVARPVPRVAGAGSRCAAGVQARTSPSAPRRSCRRRSRCAIPSLYFTNLISARPLIGVRRRRIAGAGRQRRDRQQGRFDEMKDFFGDVGEGHAAGIWEDAPKRPSANSARSTSSRSKPQAKKRDAEEMI